MVEHDLVYRSHCYEYGGPVLERTAQSMTFRRRLD
jgi:hypothetical protein